MGNGALLLPQPKDVSLVLVELSAYDSVKTS